MGEQLVRKENVENWHSDLRDVTFFICTARLHLSWFGLLFFDSKKPGSFDKHDFELLAPVLDGFSLMTYDYSSHGRYITPTSPVLRFNITLNAIN